MRQGRQERLNAVDTRYTTTMLLVLCHLGSQKKSQNT